MSRWQWLRSVLVAAGAALIAVGVAASAPPATSSGSPTQTGTGGAAATVDQLATEAAISLLRRGGNAVDAAVAAAAVLGVTEPFSCGIGGGGFMVVYRAGRRPHVFTLDHRERAPAAMRPDAFIVNGQPLAFDDARYSGLSVGVPGTVRGWSEALRRYGSTSLAGALAPAIRVARTGFAIDQTFFDQTQSNADYFDDVPATAALFLDRDGTPRDVGTTFRNPELARTYELIARAGANGFYTGRLAEAIVQAVQRPAVAPTANHTWRPGAMVASDLATYAAPQRAPVRVGYRGLDVFGMGPPSSGGSTIAEALNILEGFQLSTLPREAALHLYLEASRYAFADRGAYVADPDVFAVPLRGLLSKDFAAARRGLVGDRAAGTVAPGDPYRFQSGGSASVQASTSSTRAGSTTHLTVADRRGNVVAYTFTIESTGGRGTRRARVRLPAQQRAHRFQLQLHDAPEPGRRRQAAAQLHEPDDRPSKRKAAAGSGLPGRVDHHHHGPADPRGSPRSARHAAAGARSPARESAQHVRHVRRGTVPCRERTRRLSAAAATRSPPPPRSAPPQGSSS